MSGGRRRSIRDRRRRALGQNFLEDPAEVDRLLAAAEIRPGERVLEIGAGKGAMTLPLVQAGARVTALEPDPDWAERLRDRLTGAGLHTGVEVVEADFRSFIPPDEPYRVVSNPPFGLTTTLFAYLFDDPTRGPRRADLLVQLEVARKRTADPPRTLRSAAWAPWWTFRMGPRVSRRAFRPIPGVDAAVVIAERREQPVLPYWLAPELRELLRAGWSPPGPGGSQS